VTFIAIWLGLNASFLTLAVITYIVNKGK